MQPLLRAYGIETVALSKDTVAQASKHKARDGLSFVLLADPKLAVIGKYGVVHQKGFEFLTIRLFGVPYGIPKRFDRMAIPATLLIDEAGLIRWIDQATDYRLRGDEARIRAALVQIWGQIG